MTGRTPGGMRSVAAAVAAAAWIVCASSISGAGAVRAADDAAADVAPSAGGETTGVPPVRGVELALLRGAADAVNAFSVDLFTLLVAAEPGNFVVSPYSLDSVLAMAAYGARSETRREMLEALKLSPPHPFRHDASPHAAFAWLTRTLAAVPEAFSVSSLAAHDRRLVLRPEYVSGLRDLYRAEILAKDFSDSAGVAAEINAWAAEGTRGGVRRILSPGDVGADTRLALLNAVAFAGEWADAFPPENTREGVFETADGEVAATYMSRLMPLTVLAIPAAAPAGEGKRLASMAALPFRGGEWDMLLFAPESADGFLAELTPEALCAWLSEYDAARTGGASRPTRVELPRFAFSSEARELIPALKKLGMTRAFDAGAADFSGLAGEGGPLSLSLVRHKARIEVDEAGGRAAAASAVAASKGLAERFSLRRPFVFMIRHVPTGAVVMLGKVARPVEEAA